MSCQILSIFYVYNTKTGEISDISKCFENFVSQKLGVLTRIYAAELRYNKKETDMEVDILNKLREEINEDKKQAGKVISYEI